MSSLSSPQPPIEGLIVLRGPIEATVLSELYRFFFSYCALRVAYWKGKGEELEQQREFVPRRFTTYSTDCS